METLAYAATATYIKQLAKDSKEAGYGVTLNFDEGTFKVWDTHNKVEVFRALQMGNKWCLRGNPAYYEREEE